MANFCIYSSGCLMQPFFSLSMMVKKEIGFKPHRLFSWLQCCIYYILSDRKDTGWEIQLFSRFKVQGTFIIPEWQFVVQPAEKPGRTARALSFFPPEFMFQLFPVNLIPSKNVQKSYCGCHISESIVLERQLLIGEQSPSFQQVRNFSAARGSNFSLN